MKLPYYLAAFLCFGWPAAVYAAALQPQIVHAPVSGWTISHAVYAVAAASPETALPADLLDRLSFLPGPDARLWTYAASRLADKVQLSRSPEKMIRDALEPVTLGPWLREMTQSQSPTPRTARIADWLDTDMPEPQARRLALDLERQRGAADRSLALVDHDVAAIAAAGVDPRLIVAQFKIQDRKTRIRALSHYDHSIRLAYLRSRHNPTLRSMIPNSFGIGDLVEDLRNRSGRVVWADVGGGYGVALRQWSKNKSGPDVQRVLVDLFDWENLSSRGLEKAVRLFGSEIFAPLHRPGVILSDVASLRFDKGNTPNLVTSFESIQYWKDKVAGLVNLYNQLSAGGFMLMSADEAWGKGVRLQYSDPDDASAVHDGLISVLRRAGIKVAWAGLSANQPGNFTWLLIQKSPGSRLRQIAALSNSDAAANIDGTFTSVYQRDPKGRGLIEVR